MSEDKLFQRVRNAIYDAADEKPCLDLDDMARAAINAMLEVNRESQPLWVVGSAKIDGRLIHTWPFEVPIGAPKELA